MARVSFLVTFIVLSRLRFHEIGDNITGKIHSMNPKVCLAYPDIRVLEPEFFPSPKRVTYRKGEKARLFCSVKHLGERTVVWRKVSETNPLTIGHTTWIEDPRISVDHGRDHFQWDLVIDDVIVSDSGKYECQVSMSKKNLRHIIKLQVTDYSSNQVKRNPEIFITGAQFVSKGEPINLVCNASILGNVKRTLYWAKDAVEMTSTDRVSITDIHVTHSDTTSSHLKIRLARTDDSGIYTCKSRDKKYMSSAQVQVMTGGSNNVKRAGSSSQPRGSVLSVHCPNFNFVFIVFLLLLHTLVT